VIKVESADPHLKRRWDREKQKHQEMNSLSRELHKPREKSRVEILHEQNVKLERQLTQ
jgi:hypothetical protein